MMHVCLAEFLKRPLPSPGIKNGIGSCYCTEMSTFKDQYLVWQLPGVVLKDDSHICWSWNTQTRASAAVLKWLKDNFEAMSSFVFLKQEWTWQVEYVRSDCVCR
jgi:hypothetical protein